MYKLPVQAILLFTFLALFAWGAASAEEYEPCIDPAIKKIQDRMLKVRSDFIAGMQQNIERIGYWDSIYTDARQCNLPNYECKALGRIGTLLSFKTEPAKGLEACGKGLLIAEKNGYKAEALKLLKTMETLYAQQLNRKMALITLYKGLKIAEELGDKRSIIDLHCSIGLHYFTGREWNKALRYHFYCLKASREIGYHFGIASALSDIGSAYSCMNERAKAIPYYLAMQKYLPMFGKSIYSVQICTCLSNVHEYKGQYDSAHYYTDMGYRIAVQINSKRAMASVLTGLANLYQQTGKNDLARSTYMKALGIAQAGHFITQLPSIYLNLQKLYAEEKNYKEALKYYKLEIAVNDCLSNEKIRKETMENEFAYQLGKKENAYALLNQKSQLQQLRFRQNQYLLSAAMVVLALVLVIAWLLSRQSKLRNMHGRMLMERKLLMSQMNPHFVFNSMNSVQQLVVNKENDKAELYLSRLSKFIRGLLKSSTRESNTVAQEIDLLNAYLEMESLRFGNTFFYSVEVDPKIDTTFTRIPHLMIQPFVENAIWHGLLPKKGDRQLRVQFRYDTAQTIRCIVDDNGIGREASHKTKSVNGEESLALDLIAQRIALIRKTISISGMITLVDKKNELGQSLGTTAVIILPVLKS